MAGGAICLLSGGLDSTVALALARDDGPIVRALTIDYGQRAAARETVQSAKIAARYSVPHQVVALPFFRELDAGALLDASRPLPRLDRAMLERGGRATDESAASVWVPNRNGVFIEVAAAIAEATGASRVVVGFNREEAATFPDNTIAYMQALNRSLEFSTRGRVRLESPTAALDKLEIVRAAIARRVPLELVWPCYEGGERPCGACESCQRFARAVERAGAAVRFAP